MVERWACFHSSLDLRVLDLSYEIAVYIQVGTRSNGASIQTLWIDSPEVVSSNLTSSIPGAVAQWQSTLFTAHTTCAL